MARPDDRLSTADLASQQERPEEELREPRERERADELVTREERTEPPASRKRDDTVASDREARDARLRGDLREGSVGERGHTDLADRQPLFQDEDSEQLRRRWETVQTGFVDEPRRAVEEADELVADLMQRLTERFSRERRNLEGQLDRGEDISTEDLRVALQRYRSFFDRLLST